MANDKVKVIRYTYEKVLKDNAEVLIPQEPIFFRRDGRHILIGVFPQLATWDNTGVWELQIIEVRDNRIIRTFVRTNTENLSDIISRFEVKNKSTEEHLVDEVIQYLLDYPTEDRVTKEVFMNYYQNCIDKFNEFIK